MALEVVGSTPITHPSETEGYFDLPFFVALFSDKIIFVNYLNLFLPAGHLIYGAPNRRTL